MINIERFVWIRPKDIHSTFYKKNKEHFTGDNWRLGSSSTAITKITENAEEMKMLMPALINLSPNTVTTDWDKAVNNYWASLSVLVPDIGLRLQTGFRFDKNDIARKQYINELIKAVPEIKTEKDLAEYVMGVDEEEMPNVQEVERYKYGIPINPKEYLWWRYSLGYGRVANSIDDVDASPKIRFYLISETEIANQKKKTFELNKKAMEAYISVIGDKEKTDNALYAFREECTIANIESADITDKHMELDRIHKSKPRLFIDTVSNKNMMHIAAIEKFVKYNVFARLIGSEVITDYNDPSIVIGNNMAEAITYINNATNKVKLNEYLTRLNSVKQAKNND